MTQYLLIFFSFLVFLCAGLFGAWYYQLRRRHEAEKRLQANMIELARLREQVAQADGVDKALEAARVENIGLQQAQIGLQTRLEERERAFKQAEMRFKDEFQRIASQTITHAHDDFLKRANETFAKHQTTVLAQSDEKQTKIDALLKPMNDTLKRYEEGLRNMREAQNKEQGAIVEHLSALASSTQLVQNEAARLSIALKSGPGIRGQWGEIQLRNIVEAAGLSPHADFEEQKSITTSEGRAARPDLVVRLPGERAIAIDAKVSLGAWLQATESDSDDERMALLSKHADEVWRHVKTLSSKEYASGLKKEGSLDFVVMFLGGDHLFHAALDARPQLFQEALDKNILITTPVTLVAMLKSVAYNWRQEKATKNAREVAGLASELYDSLCRMGNLLSDLGGSLDKSVKKYNETIGSIEKRVMPRARKFSDYEMPGTEQKLADLHPIELEVRELRAGRDLDVSNVRMAEFAPSKPLNNFK